MSDPTPPDKPLWKRWWVILLALAAIAAIVGVIVMQSGDGDDDDKVTVGTTEETTATDETEPTTDTTPVDTTPTTPDDTTAETSRETSVEVPDDLVIGDVVDLEHGAVVRLNAVTPDAPPMDEFFTPDPGFSYTRADVELCAGSEPLYVSPIYFMGFLGDNSEAELSFLGIDFEAAGLAPGGCSRGLIDFNVPDGETVESVVYLSEMFEEVARWSTESSNDIDGPLSSGVEVESSPLGETITVEGGGTVVARSVTPIAPPDEFSDPGPGRQIIEVDVEICAGSESVSVNPYSWLATAEDNRTGGPAFSSGTLPSIDIAAGECAAGTVHLDMPADVPVQYVVYGDVLLNEMARWEV